MERARLSVVALAVVAAACGGSTTPLDGGANAGGGAAGKGSAPASNAGQSAAGGKASTTGGSAAASTAGRASGVAGSASGGSGTFSGGVGGVGGVAAGGAAGVAVGASSGTGPGESSCFKAFTGPVFFDGDRGDCGSSPPADLALRNGPPVGSDGGIAGSGSGGFAGAGAGPAILWCSSPTDIWGTDVVTSGFAGALPNKLQHWNGSEWTTMTESGNFYFGAGWGSSADDVWFVGHTGSATADHWLFVLHWNGERLERLELHSEAPAAPIRAWDVAVTGNANGAWVSVGITWQIPASLPPECLVPLEMP